MARGKISDQEWEVFLGVADRLGINVRPLLEEDVRFHVSGVGRSCIGTSSRSGHDGTAGIRSRGTSHKGHSLVLPAAAYVHWSMTTALWRPLTVRWNFTNQSVIARLAAGIFFPQRPALGLDQRSYSPAVLDKIVSANAEHKSAYKAQKMLRKLAEVSVSVPEIMELSGMIGQELYEHLGQQATAHAEQRLKPEHAEPPCVVAVSPDGGRIMTRAEGKRGVHDQAWKETKNACLMTMSSTPSEQGSTPGVARLLLGPPLRRTTGTGNAFQRVLFRRKARKLPQFPRKRGRSATPSVSSGQERNRAAA